MTVPCAWLPRYDDV